MMTLLDFPRTPSSVSMNKQRRVTSLALVYSSSSCGCVGRCRSLAPVAAQQWTADDLYADRPFGNIEVGRAGISQRDFQSAFPQPLGPTACGDPFTLRRDRKVTVRFAQVKPAHRELATTSRSSVPTGSVGMRADKPDLDVRYAYPLCGRERRPPDVRPPKPFGACGPKPPIIRQPNHALDRDFDPGDAYDIERIHLATPTRRRRGPRPD